MLGGAVPHCFSLSWLCKNTCGTARLEELTVCWERKEGEAGERALLPESAFPPSFQPQISGALAYLVEPKLFGQHHKDLFLIRFRELLALWSL